MFFLYFDLKYQYSFFYQFLLTQVFAFQKEYIRGISGWNFNLEDLKTAAALVRAHFPLLLADADWAIIRLLPQTVTHRHNKMFVRNLCSLIFKFIYWQLDSSNGTYHFDGANNKDRDGLQDVYNESENIYQERVNHGASARHDEVLWS